MYPQNRYCRHKESIRRNRRARSCLAPSLPAPSRSRRPGAPSSPVTGCLDIPKARMASKSLPSQFTYCRCRMPSRLTKGQVSFIFSPSLAHWATPKRVLCRALRNLSDELRGTRGTWEITGWYVRAPSHDCPQLITLVCTSGEWLLVLAAAGGVGMAAIQIGKGVNRSTHLNVLLTSSF